MSPDVLCLPLSIGDPRIGQSYCVHQKVLIGSGKDVRWSGNTTSTYIVNGAPTPARDGGIETTIGLPWDDRVVAGVANCNSQWRARTWVRQQPQVNWRRWLTQGYSPQTMKILLWTSRTRRCTEGMKQFLAICSHFRKYAEDRE